MTTGYQHCDRVSGVFCSHNPVTLDCRVSSNGMNQVTKKANKIRVSGADRFAELAVMGETIFTIQDVATIWKIKNRQTLRVLLARYVKRGLLNRIWRGLYSISSPKKIDPFILGIKALHRYAYISCETVLFNEGLINQRPTEITIVSDISKRFSLLGHQYRSRKINDKVLYDTTGIVCQNSVRIATLDRAKRDMDYFNPQKYYDMSR